MPKAIGDLLAQAGGKWTADRIVSTYRIGVLVLVLAASQVSVGSFGLSKYFLGQQDRWTVLLATLVLFAAPWKTSHFGSGAGLLERLAQSRLFPVLLPALAVLVAFAGVHLVFGAVGLSYDEVQADFDARVLGAQRLSFPLAEEWRPYLRALNPSFVLSIPGDVAWISSYLPGNAFLRALFEATVGMSWCSPALLGLALAATYGVARTLWPERRDAAVVAVLLMGASSQVLVTAMTPYAMTAHLAVNMLWLWLFLQNRLLAHGGAMVLGVLGTGLHQAVFHPLFVSPFIVMLLCQRRFRVAAFYIVGYGAVVCAWILYPVWLAWLHTPGGTFSDPVQAFFVDRWTAGAAQGLFGHEVALGLATVNLTRLIAWLNPALVLLFILGVPVALAKGALPRALLASAVLTLVVTTLLVPYQGHGWGWRYAHGVLGSFALVGAVAWVKLADGPERSAWSAMVASMTLASVLLLFPLNAVHAGRFAAPMKAAMALIQSAGTDLVIVDSGVISFGDDLARNLPDLRNAPKILSLDRIPLAALPELCRRGSIAVFGAEAASRLGFVESNDPAQRTPMRDALEAQCKTVTL